MEIKDYLLFDGAYGTYYCSKDPDRIPSCELANLYDREGILKIHRQYIKSGCMALKTNTYGANTYRLDCTEEELHKIITKGYEIAMEASEGNIPVFADIGPVINEDGQADYEQTQKIVDWFLALGATNFLFETNFDDTVFQTLVPYIRKKASAFIILSFAIDAMGYTKKGIYYQDIIRNVETLADAYGFNCLSGPAHLLEFVSQVNTEGKVLSVMPNAGYPVVVGGRMIYNDNPEYFADKVYQIYQHGVKIIGGCCGTTPEHIRQLALKLKSPKGGKQAAVQQIPSNQQQNLVANRFREKLERGQKVIACELHAPMEPDFRDTLEKSAALKERGVDLITIADSPMARARADSFLSAAKIKKRGRDRRHAPPLLQGQKRHRHPRCFNRWIYRKSEKHIGDYRRSGCS